MKHVVRSLLLVAALLAPAVASAQDWPTRPVRIVSPFAAGGTADILARMVADHLSSVFKQQFFVENRTGAGGAIGVQGVATSPPDGYNLVITNISMLVTIPVMNPKLVYHPTRDLTNIAYVAGAPVVVAVNESSGIKSIAQLVALGKKQGKPLSYSSSGIGTNGHLLGESLGKLAQIGVVHIPYKGAAIGITDLIAGHINFGLPVLGSVAAHLRSGARAARAFGRRTRAGISERADAEGSRLSRPDHHDLVLAVGAGEHAARTGGTARIEKSWRWSRSPTSASAFSATA